jgi:hypothetical protein
VAADGEDGARRSMPTLPALPDAPTATDFARLYHEELRRRDRTARAVADRLQIIDIRLQGLEARASRRVEGWVLLGAATCLLTIGAIVALLQALRL